MRINKEIGFIILALSLLSILIGMWIISVYENKIYNLRTQTNIEFIQSLKDAEKDMVFKQLKHTNKKEGVWQSHASVSALDTTLFDKQVIVKIEGDSDSMDKHINIDELLLTSDKSDSATTFVISINGEKSSIILENDNVLSVDVDSVKASLVGIFSNRLSSAHLSGLKYKVIENGMDSSFTSSFITEPGSVGNVFFESGDFIAAVDLPFLMILRRMIPELLFALILFFAVAGAFLFVYRSLQKEKQLSLLKDDFVSNMTHELKTPISVVNVAVEALSNFDVLNDKAKSSEYLDISKRELSRLDNLIDKILNVARGESKLNESREKISVKETISAVVKSLKLQQSKINIFDDSDSDYIIDMNLSKFKSVVYNLIDNAIKYGSDKQPVEIKVSSNTVCVVIGVKNFGDGIPTEHQQKVFDKFYRVPNANIHDVKGHGLGLYQVEKYVTEVNGQVILKSEKGSCQFIIHIPLYHD